MATTRPSATDQQFDDNGRSAYLPAVDQVKELQIQVQQQQQQITMLLAQMQIEGMRLREPIIPSLLPSGGIFSQIPGEFVTSVCGERSFTPDGGYTESFHVTADPGAITEAQERLARANSLFSKITGR